MKVKELVEELKKLDQELDVYMPYDSFSEGIVEGVSSVDIMKEPKEPNQNCKGIWLW